MGAVVAASLTLAALPLAAVATAGSASAAAAGALSCNGSVIYSVERGSSASSTGTLNALTTSTVGGSSVTATAISSIPAGGNANALGITDGGTAAYVVDQTTSSANSARHPLLRRRHRVLVDLHRQFERQRQLRRGRGRPGERDLLLRVLFRGHPVHSAYANVYGFNTLTNTAISGIIGTSPSATGTAPPGENGDMAFDCAGNMYVLSSDGANVAINIVHAPIPTTGSAAASR